MLRTWSNLTCVNGLVLIQERLFVGNVAHCDDAFRDDVMSGCVSFRCRYSETPLKETPSGQCHLSFIERCMSLTQVLLHS